ncbi:Non-receptor tyrosine kinase spore lysis A [Tieghemostelium lacteum]|uniref:Non-receptor tyrosine kinase spore lysis A n=1 Tax=Tieghemostelium lacteum TaxID=361077 RepID=A0A151Z2P3_TIELA|nr:Non-receptor tyrosine kinase spore lysis A [Tieghemostelium lacteum]|eukprot:KYQ88220.1 Non-receptor tyrosine kinase spore lysis A [Tieghemostelium lacteum]
MNTANLESIFDILSKTELPKYSPVIPKRDTKDNVLLDVLCTVINKLITNGDKIKNDRREFYPPNRKPPTIGIDAYLARLLKYSPCSKECFIMSLVYIDRFLRNCDLIVNSMNIHRLVITSLLISTKYLDDIFYNNEFYSQVGGISLREMNGLEVNFLTMMNYTVNCSLDEFEKYSREVEKAKRNLEQEQLLQQQQTTSVISQVPQVNQTVQQQLPLNSSTTTSNSTSNTNSNSSVKSTNQLVPQVNSNNTNNSLVYFQNSSSSPMKTSTNNVNTSIPMPTRRRGSCDHSVTNGKTTQFNSTGWVA